ncbi:MAG: S9 family peptidase [Candidatus Eisenbacteria bacterium]|nr:S9 family peptidase [Candidatus Eisenbacteria bacterium]
MTVMTPASTVLYPARKGVRAMTSEDLWRIPRVGAPVLAPDGASAAVSVTHHDLEKNEGRGRIWRVSLKGGEPYALTSAEGSSGEPAFSPDGAQLAFTRKDEKGKKQVFVLPLGGGEARKVSDLPLGAFDPRWLPDGTGLVFAGALIRGHLTIEASRTELERREKDPVKAHVTEDRVYRYWDTWLTTGEVPHLWHLDLGTGALRDLTPESVTWFDFMDPSGQFDIAPDGREVTYAGILVDEKRSLLRSALFVTSVAEAKVTCLTPDRETEEFRPRYSPDGRWILYGQQLEPLFYADRIRLMSYDRAAKTHTGVLTEWDRSPMHWEFAAGGAMVFEAEDEARVRLFSLARGSQPVRLTVHGSSGGFDVAPDGRLVMSVQSLSQPAELFTSAADGAGLSRLTRFTEPATSEFSAGEVREMSFEGAKGETIQMFAVLPPGYQAGKKYPLVHVIHGGPHGISADAFHARWNAQLFAAPGYVATMVNFQGSTSWGQDFARRIQAAWADRPFEDVMKATDVLIASGLVDESRMAAAGGSYGGYMASWIEGHTDRFRCIVNHAGVYNTLSQYASDVTQGRDKSFGGEPWDGIEKITECNPAHAAKGFCTPMLVIHGERDYRVPVTQGLECYGVLKAKGVPARLVYFPDENHWILKPRNSMFWYREVHGWLERFLGQR